MHRQENALFTDHTAPSEGAVVWLTGLAGSGKTTVAEILAERWRERGVPPILLDGDVMREVLDRRGGYDPGSRLKMAFTYGKFACALARQGHLVIVATISLFHAVQRWNREHAPRYCEVLLDVPMPELHRRDKKGLYSGSDPECVVGLGQPAQFPEHPDVVVDNHGGVSPHRAADRIMEKADELFSAVTPAKIGLARRQKEKV
ncbi:adenylyl-sulfate kinase [Amycolatopsis sp. NPDC021455]|uniref:adenylyl-sulfate kinase n=1 Tax=Amycolatopsis sp. NPDC021455 TaxID=3154901 RepID=UPI0033E03202